MAHVTGNAARRASLRFAPGVALGVALGVTGSLVGCDIVQGFQNAGDALFPPQKTYLEAPGFRLTSGGFRRLNVGVGDELYLLARSSEPSSTSLFAMRYVDPKPCEIPNVGRYFSSGLPSERPAEIAYLDAQGGRTLHFSDARCQLHAVSFESSDLPLEENDLGLVVQTNQDLVLVDPPTGHVDHIASGIQAIFTNGPGAHVLVIDGRLGAYEYRTWKEIGFVGEGVSPGSVRQVGSAFLYEDQTGVHQLSVSNIAEQHFVNTLDIDTAGCQLGWVSGSMVAYYSPCTEQKLSVWDAATGRISHLDFDADPSYVELELSPGATSLSPDPATDPYWFFLLRDVDPAGVGTLVARSPDGEELVLGQTSRLDKTTLDDDGEYGLALLDIASDTGRLVRWQPDGSVVELATGVLASAGELLVNWNGLVGDRARITSHGELEIVLERVPRRDYAYQDASHRWQAVLDDSDGTTGTLSIDSSGSRTFANRRVIAHRVRHPRHEFLDVVLPGIGYISNYDAVHDTGRLEYNNLELGFRGIVSEGVSDFIPAGNGLLYTVPFGASAGIWLARAE